MAVPTTKPLPIPPNRTSGAGEFAPRADIFFSAMPQFQTDMNALATYSGQQVSLADTARIAAEAAKAAAESASTTVVTRANEVATNTNTVVTRANEVATNTLQVAADTQQVAADAQAVADALASVADGPVASVNGKAGVVTLDAADVGAQPAMTPATQAEMEAGAEPALRSMSPDLVRKAILAAAEPLSEALTPLMPSDRQPGDVIEAEDRSTPQWLEVGASYLRSAYPITSDRVIDRAPTAPGTIHATLGATIAIPPSTAGCKWDDDFGYIVLYNHYVGSIDDHLIRIDRKTEAVTAINLGGRTPSDQGGYSGMTAKFLPDGSIVMFGSGMNSGNSAGLTAVRSYSPAAGGGYTLKHSSRVSNASAQGLGSGYGPNSAEAVSATKLIGGVSPSYPRGITYSIDNVSAPQIVSSILDVDPKSGYYPIGFSLSPDGEYLLATLHNTSSNTNSFRIYRRIAGTDNFAALPDISEQTETNGVRFTSGSPLWMNSRRLILPGSSHSTIIDLNENTQTPKKITGTFNNYYGIGARAVNKAGTRFAQASDPFVVAWSEERKRISHTGATIGGSSGIFSGSVVPNESYTAWFGVEALSTNIITRRYSLGQTFTIQPRREGVSAPALGFTGRSLFMRSYD